MLLQLNKGIILSFLFMLNTVLFSETYVAENRIYIHYDGARLELLGKVIDELQFSENHFSTKFKYKPSEVLDVKLTAGLNEMQEMLKLSSWIGGFYFDYKIYLQPPEVLIKKAVMKKVVFIEYSHYFIDSFTGRRCPDWMNEILSTYFYVMMTDEKADLNFKPVKLTKFSDFIDLRKNIGNYALTSEFYKLSVKFCAFLNSRYGISFCENLLVSMNSNASFEEALLKITGTTLEKIYDNEFMNKQKTTMQEK